MPPAKKKSPSQKSAYGLIDEFLARHDITVSKQDGQWGFTNSRKSGYTSRNAAYEAALEQMSWTFFIYRNAYVDSLVE